MNLRKTLYAIRSLWDASYSYEVFYSIVSYLKKEGLANLGLLDLKEEDFDEPLYWIVLQHLEQEDVKQCMASFFSYTYGKMRRSNAMNAQQNSKMKRLKATEKERAKKIKRLEKRIRALEHSHSYCVGYILMWIPSKINKLKKQILKSLKNHESHLS